MYKDLEMTFQKIVNFIGPPRNYGPTEEIKAQRILEELNRIKEEELLEKCIEKDYENEERARQERQDEWVSINVHILINNSNLKCSINLNL